MNGKTARKIRKEVMRYKKENMKEFVLCLKNMPFNRRLKVCYCILFRKELF